MSQPLPAEELKPILGWKVEILRFTAFPTPLYHTAGPLLFELATGAQPGKLSVDNIRNVGSAEGDYRNGKLVVKTTPSRIDFLFGVTAGPLTPTFRVIGTLRETTATLRESIERWFNTGPSLQRLAVGAVLLADASDPVDGYRKLQPLLPNVSLDPEGSQDLLYRINRPRFCRIDALSLRINRVAKWNVSRTLPFLQPTQKSSTLPEPPKSAYACRLELDVNTATEHTDEFPKETLSPILGKLLDFGTELAEKGDIP